MKPIISIKLSTRNYAGLVSLGNRLIVALTGNANYALPLPSLVSVQADITAVEDAIALWGPVGNRGSRADLLSLRQNSVKLAQTIKSLSQYVQNTAQSAAGSDYNAMAAILSTSGFDVLTERMPQGILQAVQNFHAAVSPQFNPNQVKLMWSKPLNVSVRSNVKSYIVLRGTTAVFSAAEEIGATTRSSFVDTNNTGVAQTWFYWVVPVNGAGKGAVSEAVIVSLFSM